MDDLLSIGLSNAVAAALLALVAIAAGAIGRRPALVHGLWLLVLLKLVTPPLVRIPIAWSAAPEPAPVAVALDALPPATLAFAAEQANPISPQEEAASVLVMEEEASAPVEATLASAPIAPADEPLWPKLLSIGWLAGSLGWFALALARLQRFRRLLRYVRPASMALQERTQRLSRRLGLPRCPQVGLLPGRLAPMLWAIGSSPRLLLPAELPGLFSDEQLDTLLVHELAHLRRRDHWVRALEFAVMGLYWWHPIVWYARRELREAEEQCCDAWVVSTLPAAGRTYASALMDTLDFLATAPSAVPPLASGLGQVSDLKRRLTMIMRGTTPRALSWPGCLVVFALGAFWLPLLPALHAQAPSKEKVEKKAILILTDEADKKADLNQAREKLAIMEAQLQRKLAEVARAKAELDAAEGVRHEQGKLEAARDTLILLQRLDKARAALAAGQDRKSVKVAEGNNKSIRIEVVVGADVKTENLKDLQQKLAGMASQMPSCVIVIRRESATPAKPKAEFKFMPLDNKGELIKAWRIPANPKAEFKDMPSSRLNGVRLSDPLTIGEKPGSAKTPPEKRINDLEKKLEMLFKEMQELRKELKTRPGAKIHPEGVLYDKLDNLKFRK